MKALGKIARLFATFCVVTAIASQAQTYKTLFTFDGANGNGANPLMQGADGNLYGTTGLGGATDDGTIFRVTLRGSFTSLYSFCPSPNCLSGALPSGGLVQAPDGNVFGTTDAAGGGTGEGGTVFKIAPKEALTTLYSFCAQQLCADGSTPGAVVFGLNGNVYGMAQGGGTGSFCFIFQPSGCGTIFEITPAGQFNTLYNFCSQKNCIDGAGPAASLLQASNAELYGSTVSGGNYNGPCNQFGCGTIFEISAAGKLTTLYRFCSVTNTSGFCTDGEDPGTGLIQGTDGNFYGTTKTGGANNGGTVFKITPAGKLTTLYNFCSQANCLDGQLPYAGLVQGTDGNFYGTTVAGGANNNSASCFASCGTAFEITPAGQLTTLYNFCSQTNCADGTSPTGSLLQATDGIFYGAALSGGGSNCTFGCGTLFSLSVGLGPFVEANPNVGKIGQAVGILGNNLTGASSVTFNEVPATFTVVSSTLIRATVPMGAMSGPIQVKTPHGTLPSNVPFRVLP